MIFYLKNTKVAVEVPAYQGRLHTKFEENCVKRFRDMSEQTFKFFFLPRLFGWGLFYGTERNGTERNDGLNRGTERFSN